MREAAARAVVGIEFLALVLSVIALLRRGRNRPVRGPEDLRPALVALESLLSDIRYFGRDTTWFRAWRNPHPGQRVRDFLDRVSDDMLRDAVNRSADSWDECSANSPRPPELRIHVIGQPPSPYYAKVDAEEAAARARQRVAAKAGIEAVTTALARLNALDLPWPALSDDRLLR